MTSYRRAADALLIAAAVAVELVVWTPRRSVVAGTVLPLGLVPVLTVGLLLLLLLRWRYPYRIFWVQWTYAICCLAIPNLAPFVGVLITLHAVASRMPRVFAGTALLASFMLFGMQSANDARYVTGDAALGFAQVFSLWIVLSLVVWGVGRLSYASARRALRLHELQAAEAAESIQAERLRLARELHDIVAHSVTVMILQASGAQALAASGDQRVRSALSVIETAGAQAMAELHRLLGLLRSVDPESDAGAAQGPATLADIAALVELARASGRQVQLSTDGESGPLDPSVELAAYRLVQESLTNAAKHGGDASVVAVKLSWHDRVLRVTVSNTVSGARAAGVDDNLSSGHGLQGLRERVLLVGGAMSAGPTAEGFEVFAELPRTGVSRVPLEAGAVRTQA